MTKVQECDGTEAGSITKAGKKIRITSNTERIKNFFKEFEVQIVK